MNISVQLNSGKEIRLVPTELSDTLISFNSVTDGKPLFQVLLNDSNYEIQNKSSDILDTDDTLQQLILEWLVIKNPNGVFNAESTEEDDSDYAEETPYDPEKIRVDTKQFSLRQIYDMIEMGDVDLSPDFQRHLVWDNVRKSRLIESILMRIPLPMFYFAQDEAGKISVVDGLQRLSTIRSFMNNEIKLSNLEYLNDRCGGLIYRDEKNSKNAIEPKYFRWFNMTQITVNVIDPSSPFKLKYDIFRRINTGGQPLNAQEIRNCLSSKILRKTLKEMVTLDSFTNATSGSIKDVRMDAQEFALRFILFHEKYFADNSLNNYSGNIESDLNSLTEKFERIKESTKYLALFDTAMKNAFYLFGRHAFRKCEIEHLRENMKRPQINKAMFVSWSVLLSQFDNKVIESKNKKNALSEPMANKISDEPALFSALSYSTNSRSNLLVAFMAAEDIILNNLKV